MKPRLAIFSVVLLLAISVTRLTAHHSVVATYDSSKVTTITGTVTEVKWRNPHTWLSIEVKGTGKTTVWKVEMGGPGNVSKSGIRKNSVPIPSSVTLEVWPACDGSQTATARVLTLPDGRQFDVHDSFAENLQTK